jgi:phosphatidylglycerophosphate synthase
MIDSISDLRIKCQRTWHGWSDQPWLFLQIRKMSIYVTWALLHTPLTPNGISLLALGLGVIASVALAIGQLIVGLILIQVTIILDFSDGEVSRYRNLRSKEGSYLDKIYIFLVHPSLFAGITLYEFKTSNQFSILVAGFISVISVFVFCMVVEYGRQIVVWRHFMKFIFSIPPVSEIKLTDIPVNASANPDSGQNPNTSRSRTFYDKSKHFLDVAHINDLLKLWDFPYMFVAMSFAILLELIVPGQVWGPLSISPLGIYLYFYAISYPIIVIGILVKNVLMKVIENDYQNLSVSYMDMLGKRFNAK